MRRRGNGRQPALSARSPAARAVKRALHAAGKGGERMLLAADPLVRATLEATSDAILVVDRDRRATVFNHRFLAMWNLTPELVEAPGFRHPCPDFSRQLADPERHARRIDQIHATHPTDSLDVLELADGRVIECASRNAFPGREPAGRVWCYRDVTERRRAEEARLMLAAIVESSDDAIVSKDLDGFIHSWNRGAERIFGWSSDEAVRHPVTLIIPPGRIHEEQEILRRLRAGERIEHFETERVTKSGRIIPVCLAISPMRDRGGRIVGVSKIARDISERREAEDALRQAVRRREEFLALLAHELRNPLAPLRNGLQAMQLAPASPGTLEKARAMMERQLGHMVRLVDDLLDLARIGQDRIELRRSRVTLREIVEDAVETARPAIAAASHELIVSLPAGEALLDADPTRLAQVFSNLLANSAKFTADGGRIRLAGEWRDGLVEVTVRDNGIGIPAEALPRVFEMFSQVDRTRERATGGLGIGLALVKGLVEMHGGSVSARSDGPGKGSTFSVRLPCLAAPQDDPARARGELPPLRAVQGRRILIVDDNRDAAISMAIVLQLKGNEVVVAHDGFEGIERAEAFRPQLVFMDVGMPRMNGYEAARRIRERPWAHAIPIVALSGWGQQDDREQSRRAGCDAHLVKPVEWPELERVLEELLAGS